MLYRKFGRTQWQVSEIGYGMWGMAGWTGSDDDQSGESLDASVELGCNFFDTAWGYGRGKSEQLLGALLRRFPNERLYIATKIPPKNFKWPSRKGYLLEDCFPAAHIREYTEYSLRNLGVEIIDLQQFHVWEDDWADRDEWQNEVLKLKQEGKIRHMGISVNRWEPDNCLRTLETGLIDAVQVIYNIFDQAPEDNLFPLCQKLDIGVIARVPFDEGTLTGTLAYDTTFPEGDWRGTYFVPENLRASVDRAEALRKDLPEGVSMPELALRFILEHPAVGTIIPGMRKLKHVRENIACSGKPALSSMLMQKLQGHRWDRTPTEWSQ